MNRDNPKPPERGSKGKVNLPAGNGTSAIQLLASFNTLLKYIRFKLRPENNHSIDTSCN
jgi:hypothetical protein